GSSRRYCSACCSSRASAPCAQLLAVALDHRERRAGGDRLALLDGQLGDDARLVGGDLVLHLHRLDDRDELALLDLLALLDEHLPDVALQRGGELVASAARGAALALGALGGLAGAGGRRAVRDDSGRRGADDLDVEAPARD